MWHGGVAYPDSVNLVRPPNTTIPKTLAALPKSQYATDFELVSGKELFLNLSASSTIVLLNETRGEDEPPVTEAILLLSLRPTVLLYCLLKKNGELWVAFEKTEEALLGCLTH